MTATKTFKYAVNHKSKMVVKVHTRDKSLNSFDRLNSSKMSHMSGSSIGISKSHQDLSTKKAKLFSTSTAEFNNDKPIFYSDVYKGNSYKRNILFKSNFNSVGLQLTLILLDYSLRIKLF